LARIWSQIWGRKTEVIPQKSTISKNGGLFLRFGNNLRFGWDEVLKPPRVQKFPCSSRSVPNFLGRSEFFGGFFRDLEGGVRARELLDGPSFLRNSGKTRTDRSQNLAAIGSEEMGNFQNRSVTQTMVN